MIADRDVTATLLEKAEFFLSKMLTKTHLRYVERLKDLFISYKDSHQKTSFFRFLFCVLHPGNTPSTWRSKHCSSEHVLLVPLLLVLESNLEVLKTLKVRWEEAVVLKHHECLSLQSGCFNNKKSQPNTNTSINLSSIHTVATVA